MPSTVQNAGVTYTVVSIMDAAFQNSTTLTSITSIGQLSFNACFSLNSVVIPSSVSNISIDVFAFCSDLTSVTVEWESPLSIDSSVFLNVDIGTATLHVSVGTVALYEATSVWQNFGTILPPTPAMHLNFDGIDDFVALPTDISNTLSGGTEITIEYWFKGTNVQSAVRFQPNPNDFIVAGWGEGNPQFLVSTDGGINGVELGATSAIEDNNWHHIACVWKKNDVFETYLDGVLQNSRQAANVNLPVFSENVGYLGSLYMNEELTNGNLDDVRIWNVARTATQINSSKNCELQGTETGLIAYYKFNQSFDASDNTTITTLTDATANANTGTLNNFDLTDSTSNFIAGSPVTTGSIIPSVPEATTPVSYNEADTASALTATAETNGTGLLWYTTETGGTGVTEAPTPNTATVGSTSFWVASTNDNGCESERVEIVVTVEELLGIDEPNALSAIKIYPNPTNGQVSIMLPSINELTITMYDLNGRLLLNKVNTNDNFILNLEQYETGVYVLKLKIGQNEIIKRILKK